VRKLAKMIHAGSQSNKSQIGLNISVKIYFPRLLFPSLSTYHFFQNHQILKPDPETDTS